MKSPFNTAIVGLGHVGSIMQELFPKSYIYDEPKGIGLNRDTVNSCKYVFVCVPTPMIEDPNTYGKCDTSIVQDVLGWLSKDAIIILRSTVPIGFTQYYIDDGYNIVFQPEYYGETPNHPFANPHNRNWITLGGKPEVTKKVAELYHSIYTSDITIHCVDDARVAELAKYMENCFYATKVTFCNEFYSIAESFGLNYEQVRETWLLDPRINSSHTFVYPDNRGYGGSCLPKDTAAMIYQAKTQLDRDVPLLSAVVESNRYYVGRSCDDTGYFAIADNNTGDLFYDS